MRFKVTKCNFLGKDCWLGVARLCHKSKLQYLMTWEWHSTTFTVCCFKDELSCNGFQCWQVIKVGKPCLNVLGHFFKPVLQHKPLVHLYVLKTLLHVAPLTPSSGALPRVVHWQKWSLLEFFHHHHLKIEKPMWTLETGYCTEQIL